MEPWVSEDPEGYYHLPGRQELALDVQVVPWQNSPRSFGEVSKPKTWVTGNQQCGWEDAGRPSLFFSKLGGPLGYTNRVEARSWS